MTTLSIHNVTAIEKIEQTHYVGGHEFRSTKISIADSKGNLHEDHALFSAAVLDIGHLVVPAAEDRGRSY